MADTGWISCGTAESIDRDGKGSWDNPTNAETQNDTYAYEDISKTTYTDWLRATNFGFSIPSGTVDGIEVGIDWYAEDTNVDEDSIRLVSGAVVAGDDKSVGANLPTSDTDSYSEYGGAADGWNAGLTYEDINDSTFGVQFSVANDHAGQARQCRIDHVQIKITYTEAGEAPETQDYYARPIGRGMGRGIVR